MNISLTISGTSSSNINYSLTTTAIAIKAAKSFTVSSSGGITLSYKAAYASVLVS